jgi:arylsulfatase A-like enzyme
MSGHYGERAVPLTAVRRRVALALAAVAVAAVVAPPSGEAPAGAGAPGEGEPPPNVLVILSDDQRRGTLGVMPRTRRWFARGGTTFTNAFATTPVCCPSRASILTGRYAHNHAVTTNRQPYSLDQGSTVQRRLQEAGYRTAMLGKYLNRWRLEDDPPHFDRWVMMAPPGYQNVRFNIDGRLRTVARYSTDFLADRAAALIKQFEQGGDPWFLFVAPYAPHEPFVPARRHRTARVPRLRPNPAMLERDRRDKPLWVQRRSHPLRKAQRIRRQQLRMLMSLDELVGKLMRTVAKEGADRRTLAFFLSDHGFLWSDHGLKGKNHPYTNSIRMPMLARWTGRIPAGGKDRRLAANIDVPATILDVAGIEPEPPIDGRSLLGDHRRSRLLTEAWPENHVPHWASVLTPRYQYIEYYEDETGKVFFREYYDLVNDRWQLVNLLGDRDPSNDPPAAHLAQLSLQLQRDRECRGTTGPTACP